MVSVFRDLNFHLFTKLFCIKNKFADFLCLFNVWDKPLAVYVTFLDLSINLTKRETKLYSLLETLLSKEGVKLTSTKIFLIATTKDNGIVNKLSFIIWSKKPNKKNIIFISKILFLFWKKERIQSRYKNYMDREILYILKMASIFPLATTFGTYFILKNSDVVLITLRRLKKCDTYLRHLELEKTKLNLQLIFKIKSNFEAGLKNQHISICTVPQLMHRKYFHFKNLPAVM